MQELKKRTAQRIVTTLTGSPQQPWCRAALAARGGNDRFHVGEKNVV
jgi:hypothetical protein